MPTVGSSSLTHLQDPIPIFITPALVDKTFSTDVFIVVPGETFHSTDIFILNQTSIIVKYELLGSSDVRERPLFNYEFPQTIFVVLE